MEAALQLAKENVDEAVFGEQAAVLGALVVHHHFLLPAQVQLCRYTKGQQSANQRENQNKNVISLSQSFC